MRTEQCALSSAFPPIATRSLLLRKQGPTCDPPLMLRHFALTAILLIGTAFVTEPGEDPNRFRRITVVDGLSQNSVFDILQDHRGYIWIGTQDGLNRYDGYEFKTYKHDPDDGNSLSENTITALREDRQGTLWIGTQKGGLNRFDPYAERFEHFSHDPDNPRSVPPGMIMAIGEDAEGNIWVGTHEGLGRLDKARRDFDRHTYDPERLNSLGGNLVTSILTDSRGTMWVGTWDGGLSRYSPEIDGFDVFDYDPVNHVGIPDSRITTLYEDRDGTIWIGTPKGLSRFDRDRATFKNFAHDPADRHSLSGNWITAILEDGSGSMWIGTDRSGLNRWDPAKTAFTRFVNDPDDPGSLSDNRVLSLIEDRSGVIWAGTWLGGINQLDRHRVRFRHLVHNPKDDNSLSENTIWSIHEGRDGVVWIGTHHSGLVRYDPRSDSYTRIYPDESQSSAIHGGFVRAIHEDQHGRLWLSTNEGLQLYRHGEGVVRRFRHSPDEPGGPSSGYVATILEDSRGHLWIGGNNGIDRYDPQRGTFKPLFQGEWAESDPAAENVLVLYEDSRGGLWAGTRGGLSRFDFETGRLKRYKHDPNDGASLSNDIVYSIYEDTNGNIWAGTFGGGLNRLDIRTDSFTRWTEQNSSLPTNTVFGVIGDEAGFLWLSTHKGLTRFDPRTETFRVYGAHHGVQSPEFNSGAFHHGRYTGDLYFGGINGVNIVRPGRVRKNPNPPEVVVKDVLLQSGVSSGGRDGIEPAMRIEDGSIRLSHDQNDLWIDYVGLHYSLPEANQYAYMLENYDEHWRYVGNSRRASFTNLDPGQYRFRVKAASADGIWNDEGASLDIRIDPPWWQTTVAYVAYLALFILGVFFVDTIQRRRLIRSERERAAIREAKLRAKALEIQNERQTRELEEARELQLSMLPRVVPDHASVEIEAYMRTATEVGGDYYDFHVSKDGTLTVAIGDATDHGARAGTMVTAVKSLFNILVEEHDLELVMRSATNALKRMHLGKLYMAMALAKVSRGSMRIAGAGMPGALVFRRATGEVEEVSLSGMPLGSLVNYPYEVSEIKLEDGDTVLLMSDGFAERFNGEGEMFGYERAKKAFSEVAPLSAAEIIDRLVQESDRWAGNDALTDDMTFVVMKTKSDIAPDPKTTA